MTAKTYARLAATVFAIFAVLQLTRAVMGWPVVIAAIDIPTWASWVAVVVAAALAILGIAASNGRKS